MAHRSRFAGYAGLVAAASLAVSPAQAAEVQSQLQPVGTLGYATSFHGQFRDSGANPFNPLAEEAGEQATEYRRWRRGWRRGRRWRGRRGIRGGDVLAGVLVLGGIAAIASAASNNNRRRDRDVVIVERDRRIDDRRVDDRRYDERRTNRTTTGGSGIDNAVSICLNEIERDVRVDSVDGASRISSGWLVSGTLFNGSGFSCEIGNNGRISNIDFGGFRGSAAPTNSGFAQSAAPAGGQAAGQWSDNRYADARAAMGGVTYSQQGTARGNQPLVPLTSENLPAYPGGPISGENYSE